MTVSDRKLGNPGRILNDVHGIVKTANCHFSLDQFIAAEKLVFLPTFHKELYKFNYLSLAECEYKHTL